MKKLGFKFWSTNIFENEELLKQMIDYAHHNQDIYLEMFVVPETYEKTIDIYKKMLNGIQIIIHAAHCSFGFDTGNPELLIPNTYKIEEAKKFADAFNSEIIIVHGGQGNSKKHIEETIRQFNIFGDERIAVENLPYTDDNKEFFHGTSPEEIAYIQNETKCKFCLDFSHAICAANSFKLDVDEVLKGFASLRPDMYHICDGDLQGWEDLHLHLGQGSYNLYAIYNDYITKDALISIETGSGLPKNIDPWLKDILYLRNL